MPKSTTRRLGSLGGKTYTLTVDVELDWSNVENFVVTLFYRRTDPATGRRKTVEVARIDNRSHGHTHFDRLFEEGQPMERFDGSVWDAWKTLEDNWKTYARRYERNHG